MVRRHIRCALHVYYAIRARYPAATGYHSAQIADGVRLASRVAELQCVDTVSAFGGNMKKTVEQFSADLNAKWDKRMLERQRKFNHAAMEERDVSIPAMGLMGEAGEAGEYFKKHIRDGTPIWQNRKLAYELGDVLHYLCRCADLAGYTIEDIAELNEKKIARREKRRALTGA